MPTERPPFHLAIAVHDLDLARRFYLDVLGGIEGRSAPTWVDFDLFGHQLSVHLDPNAAGDVASSPVDGDAVPIPHFGCVLPFPLWEALAKRVRLAGVPFAIGPRVRFAGEVGEQGTFFVRDPSGNAVEFKTFRDPERLFAR